MTPGEPGRSFGDLFPTEEMSMSRPRTARLALLAAAALAACGDDAVEPAAVTGPDLFCALARELAAAGERHFASLGRDARPEEYEAAERAFVEAQAARLDAIEAAAPPEISADVRTLLAAQRGRAGMPDSTPVDEKAAGAAEERVKGFERRHC
jgi:hypothetical protein